MNRLMVVLNIVALVSLAGLLYFLFQSIDRLRQAELSQKELEQQSRERAQLEQWLVETEPARLKIAEYFLTAQSLPALIERLEKLATTTDLVFSFTNAAVLQGRPETFELTFKAVGRFSDLLNFLTLVETLPVHSRFRRADLTYETEQWSGNFVLNVFVREETNG